jgi:hypothetical protein
MDADGGQGGKVHAGPEAPRADLGDEDLEKGSAREAKSCDNQVSG